MRILIPLILCCSNAIAQEYRTFVDLGHTRVDDEFSDFDFSAVNVKHYFQSRNALGPLSEFEYINKSSFISGYYSESEDFYSYGVGGRAFIGKVIVGGGHSEIEGEDNFDVVSLGYLITDDFLVNAQRARSDFGKDTYTLSSSYNYQINDYDYFGVSVSTDDDLDYLNTSTKYFKKIGDDNYMTAQLSYFNDKVDYFWSAAAKYYFSRMTGVFLSLDDQDNYSVGFESFFNNYISLNFSYGSRLDESDTEIYRFGLHAQF